MPKAMWAVSECERETVCVYVCVQRSCTANPGKIPVEVQESCSLIELAEGDVF